MMDPMLGDYAKNVLDARESEVLSLFFTTVNNHTNAIMELAHRSTTLCRRVPMWPHMQLKGHGDKPPLNLEFTLRPKKRRLYKLNVFLALHALIAQNLCGDHALDETSELREWFAESYQILHIYALCVICMSKLLHILFVFRS